MIIYAFLSVHSIAFFCDLTSFQLVALPKLSAIRTLLDGLTLALRLQASSPDIICDTASLPFTFTESGQLIPGMAFMQSYSQIHSLVGRDARSSPTLTDPDLILPNNGRNYSPAPLASSPTFNPDLESPPAFENDSFYSHPGGSAAEVGVAKAVVMPFRVKAPPPTTLDASSGYQAYDHGAALSDIYEEESTPKSKRAGSRSPSPDDSSSPVRRSSGQLSKRKLNRLSSKSDSSTESDFDTSKIMTSRLAADLAKPDDDMTDIDGLDSKRNSLVINGEDEIISLNQRAERILANAKKRLTHMEDNLTKARTSVYISPRSSPTQSEQHQPAGGLYRSISLAGDRKGFTRKSKPLYPIVKTVSAGHLRVLSETSVPSGSSRLSQVPEIRSASALEYRGKSDALYGNPTRQHKNGHSPGSSRSYNSPLRVLQEEDGSPSTAKTSPESPRGLGITASDSKEILGHVKRPSGGSPGALQRSTSSASTRSARELREQMSDLKSKITDLKSKAQADRSRRISQQSVRTPSPFTNAAEQWYAGAPEYNEPGSPINANGGVGWSPTRETPALYVSRSPKQDSAYGDDQLQTPQASRFPNEVARSDVNTPHLHRMIPEQKTPDTHETTQAQESPYVDAQGESYEEEDDPVATSEEEQIYLNEALEESLQDAEPEVPPIPDELLDANGEFERHEDRLDAFDYENMFLHSALGNYNGGLRSRSNSDSSVETRRAANLTPPADRDEGSERSTSPEDEAETQEPEPKRAVSRINEEDEPPTPRALLPPQAPWIPKSARSNSMDSISTMATFATATEGNDSEIEEGPDDILNWGNHTYGQRSLDANYNAFSSTSSAPYSNPTLRTSPTNPAGNIPHSPTQYPPSMRNLQSPRQHQPANTVVLMASLITLADPSFQMPSPLPGQISAFSDIDMELVIALLRAVGATCSGILMNERDGEHYEAKLARRRLDAARGVLDGTLGFDEEEQDQEE